MYVRLIVILIAIVALGLPPEEARPVKVEVFIPAGFPVTLAVTRDGTEDAITGYRITRVAEDGVDKVFLIRLLLGPDDRLHYESGMPGAREEGEIIFSRKHPSGRVSWASDQDVRRFVLIVWKVETDQGVWALDAYGRRPDLEAIVERGHEALPKGKFIARQ